MSNQWQQRLQQYQPPPQHQQPQQYQQPSQNPPPGQYSQPGQYPQPQQYQPHHHYPPQQQGYQGYQQQNALQHYPSQQYPPQQHGALQYGAHQQSYQQQPHSAYSQPQSHIIAPQACYNCASPDHFAQDCPEPRREVPAGALDPVRFANPLKRPRPGKTIMTKYQTHGHVNQSHTSSQGYPPTLGTQGQPGYPQYSPQHSPATPTSAQSPAQQQYLQQQWQQYYHYHQAYQQGNQQQQVPHYQQQSYQAYPTQAASYPNEAHQPSQASPLSSQYGPFSQMYQPQYSQPQQMSSSSAVATPSQCSRQHSENVPAPVASNYRQQSQPSVPPSPKYARPQQHSESYAEAEDLELLDIPDMPPSPSLAGSKLHLKNTVVSPPINLIGMPLPANFVVADTLYPIAPPAPEKKGFCQSKYLRDTDLKTLYENIRLSKYWKDLRDDPIFAERPNEDNIAALDEVLSRLRNRYVNGEASEDVTRNSRSQSQSVSARQNSGDFRGDLETLERNLAELKARAAEMERNQQSARGRHASLPQSAASDKPNGSQIKVEQEEEGPSHLAASQNAPKSTRETEDVLASLGVTGPPKPVMSNGGAYRTSAHDSPDEYHLPRSRGSSKAEIAHRARDCYTNGSPQYPQGYELPPAPNRRNSFPEGADRSPSSGAPEYINNYNYNINGTDLGNGHFNYGLDEHVTSPIEIRLERTGSHKRSYSRRDSVSDEEETPARRQEDDITPKYKRRQPKVEAAYSRRW
ncbi:hypothetical protein N7G274_003158 [Stereocaulon virgatum]|uniref:CCHC-type domain-containing protein n=1 Tax=Stereocaulon virgatum TaxID=373712 RepID=A0ABR4ALZ3_9LECA